MTMTDSEDNKSLRKHLLSLLRGGNAHISFDDFIADFSAELSGLKLDGLPYTTWQVLEHMRIAQWDILDFCRNAKHISPKWPEGYWPKPNEVGNAESWKRSVKEFQGDLQQMESLVDNPSSNLFAKIPHGSGQTMLREALLVADHNAYHLGVLVAMGRMLKK
jgi:hypothetical protein